MSDKSDSNSDSEEVYSTLTYLKDREIGEMPDPLFSDVIAKKFITTIRYNKSHVLQNSDGILSLEYSLDGSVLVAACQNNAFALYDTKNQNMIKRFSDAHFRSVNCIRFIDNFIFATGSADNIVKLWDLRKTDTSIRTLQGHMNSVWNIDYSIRDKCLITSSVDGSINTWDLDKAEDSLCDEIFFMDGLTCVKLTPDNSDMIICYTSGFMLLVRDLDLKNLGQDLQDSKADIFRTVNGIGQISVPTFYNVDPVPRREYNHIEVINDFPNVADTISFLQMHSMGYCVVSRNLSSGGWNEWTSVHYIHTKKKPLADDDKEDQKDETEGPNKSNLEEPNDFNIVPDLNMPSTSGSQQASLSMIEDKKVIPEEMINFPRLSHYAEEIVVCIGQRKEMGFSSDARVIASPYNEGIRLLGFDSDINEYSTCIPNFPVKLYEIKTYASFHHNPVLSVKFHPREYLLASCCLGGKISWYQPDV